MHHRQNFARKARNPPLRDCSTKRRRPRSILLTPGRLPLVNWTPCVSTSLVPALFRLVCCERHGPWHDRDRLTQQQICGMGGVMPTKTKLFAIAVIASAISAPSAMANMIFGPGVRTQ